MKRAASIGLSLLILAILWYHIDFRAILAAVGRANVYWLAGGLVCVIPLTLTTALRFGLLTRRNLGLGATSRLTLAASTLNLLLPSKMGDLAKAWVLRNRYGYDGGQAFTLVVFEKLVDLTSLLFWGVIALFVEARGIAFVVAAAGLGTLLGALLLVLSPAGVAPGLLAAVASKLPRRIDRRATALADQWREMTASFWRKPRRAALVWAVSLALWASHLVQIWMFARALGPDVPLMDSMAGAALAILAGLLPFTMAGIGTRDAALVYFYAPWLSAAQGAALGVLATLRYLLPALAGLPFVHDYWDGRPAVRPG